MCGIVGFAGLGDRRLLERMNALQVHRGPDDAGEFWDESQGVGMAMRRLSIVDLAGGRQPMRSADGNVVIVFNGEIFNAPELRQTLAARGVSFTTNHSDTEVILRLYETAGTDCASQLNGMFAFVIYDRRQQQLYGARDPFGIKPLHLHEHGRGIAWASEIKSFFGLPDYHPSIDPIAVEQYLGLQYIPGGRTAYRGTVRLEPGCQFTYRLGDKPRMELRRYHELPFNDEGPAVAPGPEEIRDQFLAAVQRWNMADVPVACALSGGIDSAAIVASLARCGTRVKTYSVGFRSPADSGLDECVQARRVAEQYGTEHHEVQLDLDDLLVEIPRMVRHLDEPYGGGLPSWFVFQHIAKDVKVAMTGTGGDELFSNYGKFRYLEGRPRFATALQLSVDHPGVSRTLAGLSGWLARAKSLTWPGEEEGTLRDRHRKEDAPLFWTHPFGISFPTAHGSGINERLGARASAGLSAGRQALEDVFLQHSRLSLRNRCAAVDLQRQLPDEFLLMTDRFSMAHSLEARTPFLDTEFSRFALRIHPQVRLDPDRPKRLLRDAFADWLPPGYTRLRKKGFVLPVARWLRGPLRTQAMDLFAPEALERDGFVRRDFREAFYRRFLEGHGELAETIWTVFMFRQWQIYSAFGKANPLR